MRRGNKSHKVPNVKLRPAQQSSSSTSAVSKTRDPWMQDSDEANQPETQSGVDLCPRPFKNIVVCATGILDKPTLFKQALELGATPISAFTDRVTHLIANDHGGAKYMCALERKIPIMLPSWITESYLVWLRGDDVDVNETIEKYRLPIFSNITLSLSGIDDLARRSRINKLLTHLGGIYVKNLERPVKVTHLLCSGDEETEKMKYAEKFNKRGEAQIWLVWEEWFWDSIEFGGRFEEEKYAVGRPRPERKMVTDVPAPAPPPANPPLQPRLQQLPAPEATNQDPNAQSASNSAEEAEEEAEVASVKRIPAVTLQLWETLLKPRGFEINGSKLVRSPTKLQGASMGEGQMSPLGAKIKDSKGKEKERDGGGIGSVISSFRRVNSFAPPAATTAAPRQLFRRISSIIESEDNPQPGQSQSRSRSRSRSIPRENAASSSKTGAVAGSSSLLFSGLNFKTLGEAKCQNVKTEIEGCGGRMISEDEEADADFIVVRLVSGSKIYRDEADERERPKYRTECWLERCMFEERICSPNEHVSFTPLTIETPIAGAEHINLSFSGLDQSEVCWVRRLLRALGANLAPNFSRRSTHLLCPSGTGAKFDKAREWCVPVVSMAWLEDMVKDGIVRSAEGYIVRGGGGLGEDSEMDEGIIGDGDVKGKGKEKEVDAKMVDITNNSQSGESIPALKPIDTRLGRTTTVLQHESPQHEHQSIFGKPNTSLLKRRRLSTATPPPPSSHSTSVGRHSVNTNASAGPSRNATLADIDIELDMQETRIPSSTSPSPMKMPKSHHGSRGSMGPGGASPAKVSNEVTKALQESITSLLGKRQNSEEDANANTGQPAKAGKRIRPQPKSKPQSDEFVAPLSIHQAAPVPSYDRSQSPFEPYDELNLLDGGGLSFEESMRVMYEDPAQLEEKKRLMSLFETHTQNGDNSRTGGRKGSKQAPTAVRRSTRMAGF